MKFESLLTKNGKEKDFTTDVGFDTISITTSTDCSDYSGNDQPIKSCYRNGRTGKFSIKVDLEKLDSSCSASLAHFIDALNKFIKEYGLEDVEVTRCDLRFDFHGIPYRTLLPEATALSSCLGLTMNADNNYMTYSLFGTTALSVAVKTSAFEDEYYAKSKADHNSVVDGRLELRRMRKHYAPTVESLSDLYFDFADTLIRATTDDNFRKTCKRHNDAMIRSLKNGDYILTDSRSRGVFFENNAYRILSKEQFAELCGEMGYENPHDAVRKMIKPKKVDPSVYGKIKLNYIPDATYSPFHVTTAEELRDFTRFLLSIAMEFFFGGWEPDKAVSKKFDNYKEWLYQSLKAYTYSYIE